MGWIILIIIWVAVTVLIIYPYVEKIEKLRSDRDRFMKSYFAKNPEACEEECFEYYFNTFRSSRGNT